jgi:hypothetical protein
MLEIIMNLVAAAVIAFSLNTPHTWPRTSPDAFGCALERTYKHKDQRFNCALKNYKSSGDPCSGRAFYDGPQFPSTLASRIHPMLKEVNLEWEGGRLRAANFRFDQNAKKADVESALGLPKDPLPKNLTAARFDDCANDRVCYVLEGFEHMGAGDLDCEAARGELREGNYTGPEGYWMVLKEAKMGAFEVRVELASSPKSCRLSGLRGPGDDGIVTSGDCKFVLEPGKQGEAIISVAPENERACAATCSGKTNFVGTYGYEKSEPIPVACDLKSVKKVRAEAAKAIAAKYYDEGIGALQRIKEGCSNLNPDEESWVLNDIAFAQIRAGRRDDCNATLKPLEKFAASKDKSRLKKATLANLQACKKLAKP